MSFLDMARQVLLGGVSNVRQAQTSGTLGICAADSDRLATIDQLPDRQVDEFSQVSQPVTELATSTTGIRRPVRSDGISRGIILAALVIVFLIGTFIAWEFTADDSYITFRYSKNLAEGNGLAWNADTDNPVEGYTNFLWMLLMVIPHYLSISPETFSKLVGLALLLACCATMYGYAHFRAVHHRLGTMAIVPMVVLPSTYFHALSGMETILYAFLLLVLFVIGLEGLNRQSGNHNRLVILAPVITLLAGLTRPEGLLVGMVVILTLFVNLGRSDRWRLLRYCAALLVVPGLVYFIWRYTHFGWLLPNTFYVKFGDPFNGMEWLLGSLGSIVGILLLASWALVGGGFSSRRLSAAGYLVSFLGIAALPYCLSTPMMNYMNRFLFHLLPVLALILAMSFETVLASFAGSTGKSGRLAGLIAVITLGLCVLPLLERDKRDIAHMGLYGSHLQYAHVALGDALSAAGTPDELRTLTLGDVGAIPYFSGWYTYDYVGLTDERVAHARDTKSEYVADKQPTVMILYSVDGKEPRSEQFGFDQGPMLPDYEQIAQVKWFPNYFLAVFLRKDIPSPVFTDLAQRIREVSQSAEKQNAAADDRVGFLARLRERL